MNQRICLNCGSPIESPCASCPACGSPEIKAGSPKLQALLSSAFDLLRESEFDKAKTAFEAVLKKDCESVPAYWGRLRARYHISYIQAVGEKFVPRSATRSAAKLPEDIDFRIAILYADDRIKFFLRAQATNLKKWCFAQDGGASKNINHQFTMGDVDPDDDLTENLKNSKYALKFKKNKDGTYRVAGIKARVQVGFSVVIPLSHKGAAVTGIGDAAFKNCSKMTGLMIPKEVTSIGDRAFFDCRSLSFIAFGGTVTQWSAISFGSDWDSYTGNYTVAFTKSS